MASAADDVSVIDTPDMPAIKKAVPTKPPLSEWPEAFTKRRATLKRGIVKLTSGRSVGYTDDCSPDDSFTVVCFHGFCQHVSRRLIKSERESIGVPKKVKPGFTLFGT